MQVYIFCNLFRKISFLFSCALCVFCFESNTFNQDIKICPIMLCNFAGSRTISSEENYPPTLKLAFNLTQTLTPTGEICIKKW